MKAILIAGAFGLVGTLVGTRFAILWLARHGFGQLVRDDGPTTHATKRGTPTMGGTVIIASVVGAYFTSHLLMWDAPTASALLLLFLLVGTGLVGFLDDWIKISKQRSLGLRSKAKFIGQTLVALIFGVLALNFPDERGNTLASESVSFIRDFGWTIPPVLAVLWMMLLISGTSNAVNLTDGLDGLATGCATMVFGAYMLIGIWQNNQFCGYVQNSTCYNDVRDPLDLAVVAAALTGACFGFLWWNASPAKIFLGDTGSLSLGGVMAGFAIMSRTELLLAILGGMFALITLSVMLQVSYFKATRALQGTGKRLFRMTPLHHHFELLGWAEITITIRFWLITGIFVATGLGIFYAEWVVSV